MKSKPVGSSERIVEVVTKVTREKVTRAKVAVRNHAQVIGLVPIVEPATLPGGQSASSATPGNQQRQVAKVVEIRGLALVVGDETASIPTASRRGSEGIQASRF